MTPRGSSATAAAEYVGISATKFRELVVDGRMPQPRHLDKRRIWDRLELDECFDALPVDGFNDWDDQSVG